MEKSIEKKPKITKIIGSPGCGKTTKLLSIIDELIEKNVDISKIGFFTFTVAGVEEAIDRAVEKFNKKRNEFIYFKTLHALAFNLLGLDRTMVFDYGHIRDFCKLVNMKLSYNTNDIDSFQTQDDRILSAINLCRNKNIEPRIFYRELIKSPSNKLTCGIDRFIEVYNKYYNFKVLNNVFDYTDMIELVISNDDILLPELDYIIIDEAQDLSTLQWKFVDKLAENAKELYIAGDDKQAICGFNGADINRFINQEGELVVLEQSYRVPIKVQNTALKVMNNIQDKIEVTWKPTVKHGIVSRRSFIKGEDLNAYAKEGSVMYIVRNKSFCKDILKELFSANCIFTLFGNPPIDQKIISLFSKLLKYKNNNDNEDKLNKKDLINCHKYTELLNDNYEATVDDLKCILDNLKTEEIKYKFTKNLTTNLQVELIYRLRILLHIEKDNNIDFNKSLIKVTTVHAAKGKEADTVIYDIRSSKTIQQENEINPDNELRVMFVALTRSKNRLIILDSGNVYKVEI